MKGLIVFPRAGLTCADIANYLGATLPGAARRLGLHRDTLLQAAKRYGFADCFTDARGLARNFVSAGDLCYCRGLLRVDAAAVLGVSVSAVRRAIGRHDLGFLFPRHGGEASHVAKTGYV
jgi:hypothetical protein